MSEADNKGPSRRDFIKATTGIVGSLIGLVLGIPAIGYLLGPALQEGDYQGAAGLLRDLAQRVVVVVDALLLGRRQLRLGDAGDEERNQPRKRGPHDGTPRAGSVAGEA